MTAPPGGNVLLRAARQERGLTSQRDFVDAVVATARTAGLGELALSTRTVRRWESTNPGWPRHHHAQALEALFGTHVENLGFNRRATTAGGRRDDPGSHHLAVSAGTLSPTESTPPPPRLNSPLEESVLEDYHALTAHYRHLYGPLAGSTLAAAITQHATLGSRLLTSPSTQYHRALAGDVCDAWLLSARIRLFDTNDLPAARLHLHHALEAAQTAQDDARAAAVLAHTALASAFGPPQTAGPSLQELIRIARTFAARCSTEDASLLHAWIDVAEADIVVRAGDPSAAATLVAHAEHLCKHPAGPDWLDWMHPHLLATAKADVLLSLGRDAEAVSVLQRIVRESASAKHRALASADLAAIAAAQQNPESACAHLHAALDTLDGAWHESVDARIRQARNQLEPWSDNPAVAGLDQRLYTWTTALEAAPR